MGYFHNFPVFMWYVPEDTQILLSTLLLPEEGNLKTSRCIFINEQMLGIGNQAVLQTAIAPNGFLIGPGIKKGNIKGVFRLKFWQVNSG